MRGHAAEIGEKRGEVVILELDDVGRREVVRNQDRVLLRGRAHGSGFAHEDLEQPLDHVHDVRLPFAEIRILDHVELLDQDAELLRERPFRITQLLGDRALRHFVQGWIGKDHPVHVEKGAELGRRIARSHRAVHSPSEPRGSP